MFDALSLKGKSDRSDWWVTTIVGSLVAQVAGVVALIAGFQETGTNWIVVFASLLVGIGAVWATIAVTVRRFRDRGESPWMTLLLAVPAVGGIWILIVCGVLSNPAKTRRKVVSRQVTQTP